MAPYAAFCPISSGRFFLSEKAGPGRTSRSKKKHKHKSGPVRACRLELPPSPSLPVPSFRLSFLLDFALLSLPSLGFSSWVTGSRRIHSLGFSLWVTGSCRIRQGFRVFQRLLLGSLLRVFVYGKGLAQDLLLGIFVLGAATGLLCEFVWIGVGKGDSVVCDFTCSGYLS